MWWKTRSPVVFKHRVSMLKIKWYNTTFLWRCKVTTSGASSQWRLNFVFFLRDIPVCVSDHKDIFIRCPLHTTNVKVILQALRYNFNVWCMWRTLTFQSQLVTWCTKFYIQESYVLPALYLYFVFIWEQTATCATYSINWLVFITAMKSVYSAVRTGSLN
jgi:hypothetical protein